MTLNISEMIDSIASDARKAALDIQNASAESINTALMAMATLLEKEADALKEENNKDVLFAREKGLSPAMVDRLTISDKTISSMIQGLKEVSELTSSVGTRYDERIRPNGLKISKMRVPIGVVGIIYESRPNVTVDAAAICLKSKNAVILRGGSEAFHSNTILAQFFSRSLREAGLTSKAIQLIPTTSREAIELLLKKDELIDLIIPRGGEGLIRMVVDNSRIPVIKHYKGVCHIFVSRNADLNKALPVVINAKIQRPGTCNAMETLLLDSLLPEESRKSIVNALLEKGVTLFGDQAACALSEKIQQASVEDWKAEYLDLRLAVRTVNSIDEAIEHINTYSSHHTDSIITESSQEAEKFLLQVDSASVMVNASTRFADGGEYGMGCEIGISTDKLHSRGPMGIDDLTTYKWIVEGYGQVRS